MPNMLNGPDGSEAPNEDAREARCTCDRTETLLLVGGEPMCPWCAACTALDPASLPRRPVEVLVAVGVRSDRMETAALRAEVAALKAERDALEELRGDWTGRKCPACKGGGEGPDAHACGECAGTGDEWASWRARAERAEAALAAARAAAFKEAAKAVDAEAAEYAEGAHEDPSVTLYVNVLRETEKKIRALAAKENT